MRSPLPRVTELPGENGSGGAPGSAKPPQAVLVPPMIPKAAKPVEHAEEGELRPGPVDVKIPTHAQGVESSATKINEQAKKTGELLPEKKGAEIASAIEPDRLYGPPVKNANVRETPLAEHGIAVIPPPPPVGRPASSPPPAPLAMRTPPPDISQDIVPATPALIPPPAPTPQQVSQNGDGGRPGAPGASNDPGQQADSDSDAFSRLDGVVRQDGRMEVQFGREVKTVRPKLPISAMIDAALGARSVTLKVSIGRNGNVTAVGVSKSSSSREVDQACLLAMYDWSFEPSKDKQGKPVPDVIYFTLNFR
jgi:TonB family protein